MRRQVLGTSLCDLSMSSLRKGFEVQAARNVKHREIPTMNTEVLFFLSMLQLTFFLM